MYSRHLSEFWVNGKATEYVRSNFWSPVDGKIRRVNFVKECEQLQICALPRSLNSTLTAKLGFFQQMFLNVSRKMLCMNSVFDEIAFFWYPFHKNVVKWVYIHFYVYIYEIQRSLQNWNDLGANSTNWISKMTQTRLFHRFRNREEHTIKNYVTASPRAWSLEYLFCVESY